MSEKLVIHRVGHHGDGIADTPSGPVYVPYALPGETAEVEPVEGQPDRPRLLGIVNASPQRVEPICPHFGVCGGCATQHWAMTRYLAWKRQLVVDALGAEDLNVAVDPVIDAHGDGRRRATLHARQKTNDVLEVGFSAARSHTLVAINECPILAPPLAGATKAAWAVAEAVKGRDTQARKPLDIQITQTDAGLDIDVRGSGALSATQTTALARAANTHVLARLTRHGEMVAQRAAPTIKVGRATVTLPPGAFLQATVAGEQTLTQLVLEHAAKAKKVVDLFCGTGTFALPLAETARVVAADSDANAIDALKRAHPTGQGLKPVEAQARDLFRRPLQAFELKDIDAIVFDPPRQGAEAQAREIAAAKTRLVIAVSCNPATFARDARILIDAGYRLTRVTPVDQFRYSSHVELVARLER